MKILTFITLLISIISVFYKLRYKLLNLILAIRVLRELTVKLTMNMPVLRKKMLPVLFGQSNS